MLIWLLGTAAICWHAATQFTPRVEDRIYSRIQSVLTPITSTSTPVVVSVHGRDATLTGRAADNQQRVRLLTAVEGVPGVRSVADQLTLLETAPTPDKDDADDSTGDTSAPETVDEATTLTVIDSTTSESLSESANRLPENSLSTDTAVSDDNTDNLASGLASRTPEPVDPVPSTGLQTDTDTVSAADTDLEVEPDPDSIEEPRPQDQNQETTTSENTELAVASIESDDPISFVEAESTSLLAPSLDFNIQGKTLAVSGKISSKDDVAPLIRSAMISFDLDYISNTIELSDDTGNASWLESLSEFLPDMAGLENPSIEINADDIHLGGSAPNAETQEAVLGAAVSLLGAYNMSEEIALKNPDSPAPIVDESTASTVTQAPAVSNETIEVADSDTNTNAATTTTTTATATATANDTDITTNEDSDAIGTSSDQTDDNVKPSLSAIPADALSNALSDLPSMDILFESSSDILTIDSLDALDSIANVLLDHPDIPVRIEGHTDASGTKQENLILSQLRANSVRDYLIDRGVSIYRLKAYGFGEGVPISDNSTPEGRADNRRIEFNVQR